MLTSLYNDILARDISSRYGASFETAEKYINYLKESLLIYELPIFSFKLKMQFKQNKKTYPVDTGIRNAVCLRFSHDIRRLAETVIFLEIRRRNFEVYYWKGRDGYEVDFVVKEGQKLTELIQVAWDVRDEATRRREERALQFAMEELDVDRLFTSTGIWDSNHPILLYILAWNPWYLQNPSASFWSIALLSKDESSAEYSAYGELLATTLALPL
ncbi:putative ATPase [groundwater metagenome]